MLRNQSKTYGTKIFNNNFKFDLSYDVESKRYWTVYEWIGDEYTGRWQWIGNIPYKSKETNISLYARGQYLSEGEEREKEYQELTEIMYEPIKKDIKLFEQLESMGYDDLEPEVQERVFERVLKKVEDAHA